MKQRNNSSFWFNFREIITLVCKLNIRGLLFAPTHNSILQFLRYCFVGGIATVVDWTVLFVTEGIGLHYLLAATIGFACGLISNYFMSKFMVFNGNDSRVSKWAEFMAYAVIGIVGLLITLLIMYVMTDLLRVYFMISKVIVTVVVLFWNYFARRMLYR